MSARSRVELVARFQRGLVGRIARTVSLEGASPRAIDRLLLSRGCMMRREPMVGPRLPGGGPSYVCRDGRLADRPDDPEVTLSFVYAHEDGSLVRLYPHGDPEGRQAPAGEATAVKAVLARRPVVVRVDGRVLVHADTSLSNESFRVSDLGKALPKSFRRRDGARSVDDPGASLRGLRTLLAASWIPLRGVDE